LFIKNHKWVRNEKVYQAAKAAVAKAKKEQVLNDVLGE